MEKNTQNELKWYANTHAHISFAQLMYRKFIHRDFLSLTSGWYTFPQSIAYISCASWDKGKVTAPEHRWPWNNTGRTCCTSAGYVDSVMAEMRELHIQRATTQRSLRPQWWWMWGLTTKTFTQRSSVTAATGLWRSKSTVSTV